MKKFAAILLLFLLLHAVFPKGKTGALMDLAETAFRACLRSPAVRTVFDLERDEAAAVFGEDGRQAFFL